MDNVIETIKRKAVEAELSIFAQKCYTKGVKDTVLMIAFYAGLTTACFIATTACEARKDRISKKRTENQSTNL